MAIFLVIAYAEREIAQPKSGIRSKRQLFFAALIVLGIAGGLPGRLPAQALDHLKVQVSLGHEAINPAPFYVRIVPSGGVNVDQQSPWQGQAGAGHAVSKTFTLDFPATPIEPLQNMHVIWSDLIAHSNADTVRRLAMDPAWRIDPRRVVFELDPDGTSGFSLTIDQLQQNKDFWIPSLDLYISVGDQPLPFAQAQMQLSPYRGARVLDQVEAAPEASYSDFENKWPNMGDPAFAHPVQEGPGISSVSPGIPRFESSP